MDTHREDPSTVADLVGDAVYGDDEEEIEALRSEIALTTGKIQEFENELQQIIAQLDDWNKEDEEIRQQSTTSKVKDAKATFNDKPAKGVAMLLECGEIPENTPTAVATYLHSATGLNKSSLGNYLGENDAFNLKVLEEFAHRYDFVGQYFDEALRIYLSGFRLPGESQKIDRMMEAFAKRYHECNPQQFANSDTAYVLAFATIMLNTSIHNPNIKDKMTLEMFVGMNRGIDNGASINEDLLSRIYESIKEKEFDLHDTNDTLMETFVDPEKSGWMLKEGGRAKTLKRRFFILKNNCLYYFENESATKPKGTIPLENLVVQPLKDPRKPNWFEIRSEDDSAGGIKAAKTKQGKLVQGHHSSYKMQANNSDDMNDWIVKLKAAMTKNPLMTLYQDKLRKAQGS
eukprot:gene238-3616_t